MTAAVEIYSSRERRAHRYSNQEETDRKGAPGAIRRGIQDQTIKVCLTREVKAQRGKLILFPLVGVVKIIAMTEAVISRNPKIDTVLGPSKAQTTCFVDLTLLTFIARIIAGNQEQEEALRAMASDKIEAGRPVAR